MIDKVAALFKKLGLNEKAAKIYFISLSVGPETVQRIAKRAETKRATAYVAIDDLVRAGLMQSFQKGKKRYFVAAAPEQILDIVRTREHELDRDRKEIELMLPELKSMYQQPESKIVVKYYEGREGVMRMVKDFLHEASGNTIQMAYPADRLRQLFSQEELGKLLETRLKKKVKTETLYTLREGVMEAHPEGTRIKIDGIKYPLSADIAIYKNKVRIASLGEQLSGVVIEDKAITETLRSLFKLAFDQIKKK